MNQNKCFTQNSSGRVRSDAALIGFRYVDGRSFMLLYRRRIVRNGTLVGY